MMSTNKGKQVTRMPDARTLNRSKNQDQNQISQHQQKREEVVQEQNHKIAETLQKGIDSGQNEFEIELDHPLMPEVAKELWNHNWNYETVSQRTFDSRKDSQPREKHLVTIYSQDSERTRERNSRELSMMNPDSLLNNYIGLSPLTRDPFFKLI